MKKSPNDFLPVINSYTATLWLFIND